MKRFFKFVGVILALFSFSSAAFSAGGSMELAQLKAKLKANVSENEFGDRVIGPPSEEGLKNAEASRNIPPAVRFMLVYVNPKMDFDDMNKITSRSMGIKASDRREGKVPVSRILDGIGKYLASQNMNLRPLNFSPNNLRSKLDEGIPLYVMVFDTSVRKEIIERMKERSNAKSSKDWDVSLRKLEKKKFPNDSKRTVVSALVMGYNKKTGEFMLYFSDSGQRAWFTEKELKSLTHLLYQLRI